MRELLTTHYDYIKSLLWNLCGHKELTEDLTHDIFIFLWERPEVYEQRDGVKFSTWLYRVVTSKYFNYIKAEKAIKNGGHLREVRDVEIKHEQDFNMELGFILDVIKTAPEQFSTALILYHENYSFEEIARLTQTNISTARSRAFRGRNYVRKYFETHEIQDYKLTPVTARKN